MHPCYDNFQKVLKDNMTVDVFKSIVVSLDEIIELKVAIKMDDKFKEFNRSMQLNMEQLKTQIHVEMES